MKNSFKLRSLLSVTLAIALILIPARLFASSTDEVIISDAEHKKIIEQYINEIRSMQNQVGDIALSALQNTPSENVQLKARINLVANNIERLNKIIQDYLKVVSNIEERNRHVLLTFNVLNLVKSSLYSLSLLSESNTDVQRLALLDEYFRSRVASLDTLKILESILQNYGT